jgi:hypothetical protein
MNEIKPNIWLNMPYRIDAGYNGDFFCLSPNFIIRLWPDPEAQKWIYAPGISNLDLGRGVLETLAQSCHYNRVIGPYNDEEYNKAPEDFRMWEKNIRKRFAYKTRRALYVLMRSCDVFVLDKEQLYKFSPLEHYKAESWGREKDDGIEDIFIPLDSGPEEIGKTLRLAFERCTGPGAEVVWPDK